MKKVTQAIKNLALVLPAIAITLATASVSQACFFWYHQPDVPVSLTNGE